MEKCDSCSAPATTDRKMGFAYTVLCGAHAAEWDARRTEKLDADLRRMVRGR